MARAFCTIVTILGVQPSESTSETKDPNHKCHYDNRVKKSVCGPGGSHKDERLPPTAHVLEEKSLLKSVAGQRNYDFFNDHAAAEKAGAARANWDHLARTSAEDAEAEAAWTSSWDHDAASRGYVELCGPFQQWLAAEYLLVAAQRGRAPVRCLLAQHQGLGDQIKGVMRCWTAALLTQRPLVMDHSRSRSSWLWADDASILPAQAVRSVVFFNGSHTHGVAPSSVSDKHGTDGFEHPYSGANPHSGAPRTGGASGGGRNDGSGSPPNPISYASSSSSGGSGGGGSGNVDTRRRRLRLSTHHDGASAAIFATEPLVRGSQRAQQRRRHLRRRLDGQHPPKGGGSGGGNFPTERHRSASSGHGPGHGGHSADGHTAAGHGEVEVGQSFARPDGLLAGAAAESEGAAKAARATPQTSRVARPASARGRSRPSCGLSLCRT